MRSESLSALNLKEKALAVEGLGLFGAQGGLDLEGQIWYAPQGMGRWRVAMRLVGVGWYIGLCIFLGVWGGLWLDSRLNTGPVLVIAGLILGIVVAFYGVYRMLLPSMGNRRDKESN